MSFMHKEFSDKLRYMRNIVVHKFALKCETGSSAVQRKLCASNHNGYQFNLTPLSALNDPLTVWSTLPAIIITLLLTCCLF